MSMRGGATATFLVLVCLGASGCAPKVLYGWDRYEESLYASYVGRDDARAAAALEATIASAEQKGTRIPPGVCAEYGYTLYRSGQTDRAIRYFQQEAQLFPESKPLMDKLTAKVQERAAAGEKHAAEAERR